MRDGWSSRKSLRASQFKVTACFNLSRLASMRLDYESSMTDNSIKDDVTRWTRSRTLTVGDSATREWVWEKRENPGEGAIWFRKGWLVISELSEELHPSPSPLRLSPFHFVLRSGMQASSKLFQSGRNFVPVIKAAWILDGLIYIGYSDRRRMRGLLVFARTRVAIRLGTAQRHTATGKGNR